MDLHFPNISDFKQIPAISAAAQQFRKYFSCMKRTAIALSHYY